MVYFCCFKTTVQWCIKLCKHYHRSFVALFVPDTKIIRRKSPEKYKLGNRLLNAGLSTCPEGTLLLVHCLDELQPHLLSYLDWWLGSWWLNALVWLFKKLVPFHWVELKSYGCCRDEYGKASGLVQLHCLKHTNGLKHWEMLCCSFFVFPSRWWSWNALRPGRGQNEGASVSWCLNQNKSVSVKRRFRVSRGRKFNKTNWFSCSPSAEIVIWTSWAWMS